MVGLDSVQVVDALQVVFGQGPTHGLRARVAVLDFVLDEDTQPPNDSECPPMDKPLCPTSHGKSSRQVEDRHR